jgi:two-component system, NtrC family, sensor histidine kinase HydH
VDIRTQAALLAAIVTLALSAAALLRESRPRVFTLFALFSADLFLFSLAIFFLRWSETFGAVWWERLAVASGALVPAAALAFFLEFLGVARRPARRARNTMLAGSLSGFVVALTPLVAVKPAKLLVAAYVIGGLAAVLSTLWARCAAPRRRSSGGGSSTCSWVRSSRSSSRRSTCSPASACLIRRRGWDRSP